MKTTTKNLIEQQIINMEAEKEFATRYLALCNSTDQEHIVSIDDLFQTAAVLENTKEGSPIYNTSLLHVKQLMDVFRPYLLSLLTNYTGTNNDDIYQYTLATLSAASGLQRGDIAARVSLSLVKNAIEDNKGSCNSSNSRAHLISHGVQQGLNYKVITQTIAIDIGQLVHNLSALQEVLVDDEGENLSIKCVLKHSSLHEGDQQ